MSIKLSELITLNNAESLEKGIVLLEKLLDTTNKLEADTKKNIDNISKSYIKLAESIKNVSSIDKEGQKIIADSNKKYNELSNSLNKQKGALDRLSKTRKDSLADVEKLKKGQNDLTKLEKERLRLEERLKQSTGSSAKQLAELRVQIEKNNRTNKEQAKINKGLLGDYDKLSLRARKLKKEYKDLAAAGKENTVSARKLRSESIKLDKRLKSIDASVGDFQRNVGNYSKSLNSLGKTAVRSALALGGVVLGVQGLSSLLRNAFETTSNFSLAISKVEAVSGATSQEMAVLTDQAKELGETTQFSASQVAELQLELSKLGFTPEEINKSTKAILDLSTATDEALGETAQVVGNVVRALGLSADESARVSDVLAKSFSSSALDLEKFRESFKLVGPISKAANIDLETTTSLLGNLADSGLSGSLAGNALKRIISQLADENSELSKELGGAVKNSDQLVEALGELSKKNIDLTRATELTDERSKAAFLTFLNGVGSINSLRDSLNDAEGSAARMAATVQDNLAGDVKQLQSAFEGLILSGGGLDSVFRGVVQGATGIIKAFTGANNITIKTQKRVESLTDAYNNEVESLEILRLRLQRVDEQEESRKDTIDFLNKNYPELIKNIDLETASIEELTKALDTSLDVAKERFRFQVSETRLKGAEEKRQKALNDQFNAEIKGNRELRTLLKSLNKLKSEGVKIDIDKTKSLEDQLSAISKNTLSEIKSRGTSLSLSSTSIKLNSIRGDANTALARLTLANQALTDAQSKYDAKLKLFLTLQDKSKKKTKEGTEATKESDNAVKSSIETLEILKNKRSNLVDQLEKEIDITDKGAILSKKKEIKVISEQIRKIEELGEEKNKSKKQDKESLTRAELIQKSLIKQNELFKELGKPVSNQRVEFIKSLKSEISSLNNLIDSGGLLDSIRDFEEALNIDLAISSSGEISPLGDLDKQSDDFKTFAKEFKEVSNEIDIALSKFDKAGLAFDKDAEAEAVVELEKALEKRSEIERDFNVKSTENEIESLKKRIDKRNEILQSEESKSLVEKSLRVRQDELTESEKESLEQLKKIQEDTISLQTDLSNKEIDLERQKQDELTQEALDGAEKRDKIREEEFKSELERRQNEATFVRNLGSSFSKQINENAEQRAKLLNEEVEIANEFANSIENQQDRANALKEAEGIRLKAEEEIARQRAMAEFKSAAVSTFTQVLSNELTRTDETGKPQPFNVAFQKASTATAATLAARAIFGFEKGGLVEGGEQIVRINEKGQEFVIDAPTTKALGLNRKGASMSDFHRVVDGGGSMMDIKDLVANRQLMSSYQESSQNISNMFVSNNTHAPNNIKIDYDKMGRAVAKALPRDDFAVDAAGHISVVQHQLNKKSKTLFKNKNKSL